MGFSTKEEFKYFVFPPGIHYEHKKAISLTSEEIKMRLINFHQKVASYWYEKVVFEPIEQDLDKIIEFIKQIKNRTISIRNAVKNKKVALCELL